MNKNYVVVIIHHTQWKKLQLILLEIEPVFFFYVLSATNSVAEGHLAKLKDLYKVSALSKGMFL